MDVFNAAVTLNDGTLPAALWLDVTLSVMVQARVALTAHAGLGAARANDERVLVALLQVTTAPVTPLVVMSSWLPAGTAMAPLRTVTLYDKVAFSVGSRVLPTAMQQIVQQYS